MKTAIKNSKPFVKFSFLNDFCGFSLLKIKIGCTTCDIEKFRLVNSSRLLRLLFTYLNFSTPYHPAYLMFICILFLCLLTTKLWHFSKKNISCFVNHDIDWTFFRPAIWIGMLMYNRIIRQILLVRGFVTFLRKAK